MQTLKFQEHFEARKWFQLLSALQSEKDIDCAISFMKMHAAILVQKTHPPTLSKLLSKITDLRPDLELLLRVEKELELIPIRNNEQEEALVLVRINKHMLMLDEAEFQIYEYKKRMHRPYVQARLNKLFYLYYERTGDMYQAYGALRDYMESNPENENMRVLANKLAYFALVSDEIHSFEEVMKYLGHVDRKDVLLAYNSGDVKMRPVLSLQEIGEQLELSDESVLLLVMKALGKGLVRGHLDGDTRTFHMNSVVSRALDGDGIRAMKERFAAWRTRVAEALASL
ncbi:UNVERIFIED_CONTAM: hypothetical protein PYX00_011792 [Menopon gallinae]|uniref:Uncharacterized protein n=1 Tax=Menopon gallinae TaxID=328185 RepID=A0AAW2H8J2_9NEOP